MSNNNINEKEVTTTMMKNTDETETSEVVVEEDNKDVIVQVMNDNTNNEDNNNNNNYADVHAPMDLVGGYELNVHVNGKPCTVRVPKEGVKEGELFRGIIITSDETKKRPQDPHMIPYGHWRDGLCDCCTLGICHPTCCMSWFCAPISIGQIMTRLHLNSIGRPSIEESNWLSPCKFMTFIMIIYIIIEVPLQITVAGYKPKYTQDSNGNYIEDDIPASVSAAHAISAIVRLTFLVFIIVTITKTRKYIRTLYSIPNGNNICRGGVCEDCCCAFWCTCCTLSQMSRHTVDFRTYPASCCSETGVARNVPPTIPNVV